MLVLSRKTGERILIGKDVTLTVIRVGPNAVRLGFDAPNDLNIVREELCLEAKPSESYPASETQPDGIAAAS